MSDLAESMRAWKAAQGNEDLARKMREWKAAQAKPKEEETPFLENVRQGAVGRGRELLYKASNALAFNPEVKKDIAEEKVSSEEKYAPYYETSGGKIGSLLADEAALLPVGGVVGSVLKGGVRAIKGTKRGQQVGKRLRAAADQTEAHTSSFYRSAEQAADAMTEADRVSKRLLGRFPGDKRAWTAQKNRQWKRELAKGNVPDLRDMRKFEQNFANDMMEAGDNAAKAMQKTRLNETLAKRAAKLERGEKLKSLDVGIPTGLLGNAITHGAARGAVGGALLADEGNSLEGAMYGGMLGGALPGAATLVRGVARSPVGKVAGAVVDAPVRLGSKAAAVLADSYNKRFNKYYSDALGVKGIQRVNQNLTNLIEPSMVKKLAAGEWSTSQFISAAMGKVSPKDPDKAKILRNFQQFLASEGGALKANQEEE